MVVGGVERKQKMILTKKVLAAGFVAMAIFVLVDSAMGQRRQQPRDSGRRFSRPTLKVGQAAPDFELPILKEGQDAEGNKVNRITDEKIKLSSFRGKKIVCVFFSSYT